MKLQVLKCSNILWLLNFYVVSSDKQLEKEYIKHFGNHPENLNGQWPQLREMEANGTLADFCSRVHYNGRASYEVIEEFFVKDGHIHFEANEIYEPMLINLVRYKSEKERQYYYLTKGINDDYFYYVEPINPVETEYRLLRRVHVFLNH